LGNTQPGDGFRYRGRGLIQITGRANYTECGAALGFDLEGEPEKLGEPELAARSAAWFWDSRSLNDLADNGDFMAITKRINGGLNGYADRVARFETAMDVLA
jgi:putative chitinase